MQRPALPERHRDRVQAVPAVEVQVEDGVDDVEAAHPEADGEEQQPRHGAEVAGDREPGGRRSQPQRQTERVVTEPGEALGVGVEDERRQRDRPQVAARLRELERREHQQGDRDEREQPDLAPPEPPGGELSRRRARVARVDLGVDEPVEGHRGAARAHHGHGDPEELRPGRQAVGGKERAGIRERQRVHAVLDLDEPGEECGLGGGAASGHAGESRQVAAGAAVSPLAAAAASSPASSSPSSPVMAPMGAASCPNFSSRYVRMARMAATSPMTNSTE